MMLQKNKAVDIVKFFLMIMLIVAIVSITLLMTNKFSQMTVGEKYITINETHYTGEDGLAHPFDTASRGSVDIVETVAELPGWVEIMVWVIIAVIIIGVVMLLAKKHNGG